MNHNTEVGELTTDELLQVSGGCPPAVIAGLIILAGVLAFDIAAGVFDGANWSGGRGPERPL